VPLGAALSKKKKQKTHGTVEFVRSANVMLVNVVSSHNDIANVSRQNANSWE
jgi:hypothetical protein